MKTIKKFVKYSQNYGIGLTAKKILAKKSSMFRRQYVRDVDKYLYKKFFTKIGYEKGSFDGKIDPKSPIWVMWWQGEDNAPCIVRLVLQSIRKHAEGHPVILITKNNYQNYTKTAYSFYKYVLSGQITLTHFSDYMRFELLYLHGGFWFDATLLMNEGIPEWVYKQRVFSIKQGDVLPKGVNWDPCWSKSWTAYCWGGCSGDPLFKYILDFLNMYHQYENIMIDYLLIDRIIQLAYDYNNDAKSAIDSIPVNNTDCLSLCPALNKHEPEINLNKDTFLFKLTWKQKFSLSDNENNPTIYSNLLNKYGVN